MIKLCPEVATILDFWSIHFFLLCKLFFQRIKNIYYHTKGDKSYNYNTKGGKSYNYNTKGDKSYNYNTKGGKSYNYYTKED
jgi:hypothetical protein